MLNLFLAVLLGNFDNARLYMDKKKLFSELEICKRKNMGLKQSLRYVLGKVSEQVIAFTGILNPKKEKSRKTLVQKRANTISSLSSRIVESQGRSSNNKLVKTLSLPVVKTNNVPMTPSEMIPEMEEDEFNKSNNSKRESKSARSKEDKERNSSKGQDSSRGENSSKNLSKHLSKKLSNNLSKLSPEKHLPDAKDEEDAPVIGKDEEEDEKAIDGPANQQNGTAYDEMMEVKTNKVIPKSSNQEVNLLRDRSRSRTSKADMTVLVEMNEEEKMKFEGFKFANLKRAENQSSGTSDRMEDIMEETSLRANDPNIISKILNYMRKSSLFIFHEKWSVRRFLLILVLGPDNLIEREQAMKN